MSSLIGWLRCRLGKVWCRLFCHIAIEKVYGNPCRIDRRCVLCGQFWDCTLDEDKGFRGVGIRVKA